MFLVFSTITSFAVSELICCRAKLQLASVEESGSPEPEPAADVHEPQEALHLKDTDTQQQTALTDKELQLAAVKQRTEQLLAQVAELQSSAVKTSCCEQQSSSATAQLSSQLEQLLLTSQASIKQLQQQLGVSTHSATSAVSSLQGEPLYGYHRSHLASSCLPMLLVDLVLTWELFCR